MNQNYLKKFIKYVKKVYDFEEGIRALTDKRIGPMYTTAEVVLPVYMGFCVRIRSFNELKYRIATNDFNKIISKKSRIPKNDIIKDTMKVIDINKLRIINEGIIKKAR